MEEVAGRALVGRGDCPGCRLQCFWVIAAFPKLRNTGLRAHVKGVVPPKVLSRKSNMKVVLFLFSRASAGKLFQINNMIW